MTSTSTPEIESGNGVPDALCVRGERLDPNTLRTDPGAKPGRKLAPFVTLVMAGVPEPDPDCVTLIVTEALLEPL